MKNVVLWSGPVTGDILAPFVPRGWSLVTVSQGAHGGIGSDDFAAFAESLGPDPLTQLLPDARRILLFGFSAAHGFHERILQRVTAARDERIVGLCALDAYFEGLSDTTPKPGHLAWLEWVLAAPRGRRALFTTGHTSNGTHRNGADSFGPLAEALALRPLASVPASRSWVPEPHLARRRGPITWLDFLPEQLTHRQHATQLGPLALASWWGKNSSIAAVVGAFVTLLFARNAP